MKPFLRGVLVLALCHLAWGQGTAVSAVPVVVNGVGQPQPQAIVAISTTNPCGSSPGYTNCAGLPSGNYSGTTPPSNLATTYVDISLGTACVASSGPLNGTGCANPGAVDGQGNVVAYVAAGGYWCTVYGNNITAQVQPCVAPAPATGSGLLSSNNVWTGTNNFSANTIVLGTVNGTIASAGNNNWSGQNTFSNTSGNAITVSNSSGNSFINITSSNSGQATNAALEAVTSASQNGDFRFPINNTSCAGWTFPDIHDSTIPFVIGCHGVPNNFVDIGVTTPGRVTINNQTGNAGLDFIGVSGGASSHWNIIAEPTSATGTLLFQTSDATGQFEITNTNTGMPFLQLNSAMPAASIVGYGDGTIAIPSGVKSGTASNTDQSGQIVISSSTTGTYSFANTYANAPYCQITPVGDPTSVGVYWVTATTTVLTAHVKSSGSITFNYYCGLTS